MWFAKILGGAVVKHPYTFADLKEENPYTRYDRRFTIPEWYALTEEAANTGSTVVEVEVAQEPEYDSATHYIKYNPIPILIGAKYTCGWEVLARPPTIENPFPSVSADAVPEAG